MASPSRYLTRPAELDRQLVDFHGLLTVSAQMKQMFALIERVARSEASVLVRGETGSGKELVASAVHRLSQRASGPFHAINCATLTPELLASELFGHVRGAFTGAVQSKQGLFELADRGTIFLDEVAEIPLDVQARLLRVLQEQSFIPLGATKAVKVNVRVVSATHQSLREAVERKLFRADLMYRIRVIPIFLPPLRDRAGDVEALTWTLSERMGQRPGQRHIERIAPEAMDALRAYPWPGNVRELINVLEYAAVVGSGDTLELEDLTPELRGQEPPTTLHAAPLHAPHEPPAALAPIEEEDPERARLVAALNQHGWRRVEAAEALGMSRSTLWRKMRELGL
jgi:two-component system, NtrC family, response regulator AtoC